MSADTCAFGTSGFDIAASKTFKPFPGVSFNITYGDGEFLSGPVGFDTLTIGGLSVTGQEIGVPTLAAVSIYVDVNDVRAEFDFEFLLVGRRRHKHGLDRPGVP